MQTMIKKNMFITIKAKSIQFITNLKNSFYNKKNVKIK